MTTNAGAAEAPAEEEGPDRLNAPLVRVLMWGAGMRTLTELATAVRIDKSQIGRAYYGHSSPSAKMLRGFGTRFPLVPVAALVRPQGDPLLRPEALGLTPEQVQDVYPEEFAAAAGDATS